MSFFDEVTNFFSGGKQKGYGDYADTLNQGIGQMGNYVNQGNAYLNPYNQNGMNQYGTLQSSIGRMMNPQQFMSDMMKGYTMSPQAQHQMTIGNDAAMNAAAASGMMGSTPLLTNINEQSQDIANRDQQQYLNNAMGIYNQGLGTSQGLYNSGLGAAGNMAGNMTALAKAVADMYNNMGAAKEKGSEASTGGLSNLIGSAAGLLSFL